MNDARNTFHDARIDPVRLAKAAIDQIIEAVSAYAEIIGAFRFEIGNPSSEVEVTKADDHFDLYELAQNLMPDIEISQINAAKRLALAMSFIPDQKDRLEVDAIESDMTNASVMSMRAGFYIGQLFGARMAGASEREMRKLGENLLRMFESIPCYLDDFLEIHSIKQKEAEEKREKLLRLQRLEH